MCYLSFLRQSLHRAVCPFTKSLHGHSLLIEILFEVQLNSLLFDWSKHSLESLLIPGATSEGVLVILRHFFPSTSGLLMVDRYAGSQMKPEKKEMRINE